MCLLRLPQISDILYVNNRLNSSAAMQSGTSNCKYKYRVLSVGQICNRFSINITSRSLQHLHIAFNYCNSSSINTNTYICMIFQYQLKTSACQQEENIAAVYSLGSRAPPLFTFELQYSLFKSSALLH